MTRQVPLLDVRDLHVNFRVRRGNVVQAVDGVSLHLTRGETLGLVGESGSGKSTIGNAILGVVRPTSGRILLDGRDITHTRPKGRRDLAGRLQAIFQDPYSSLNPSRTIGHTLAEPLKLQRNTTRQQARAQVAAALGSVGLPPDVAQRYPAHFSGGQRQRIAIARALIRRPGLVICDEPTSALDLSVQAQILNLLLEMQQELGLAYLFISHDIDVIRHMSHRVAVLFKGHLVEEGPTENITGSPHHAYTRTLLAAVLAPDPHQHPIRRSERAALTNSPSAPDTTTTSALRREHTSQASSKPRESAYHQ